VLVLKGSVKCVLVNLASAGESGECRVCRTSDLLSLPGEEEEGTWLSVLVFV